MNYINHGRVEIKTYIKQLCHYFQVNDLLVANSKGKYQHNVTLGTLYNYPYTRRRLLATTGTTNFTGINNPVVCLENDELMMFFVTNEYYPVYDR